MYKVWPDAAQIKIPKKPVVCSKPTDKINILHIREIFLPFILAEWMMKIYKNTISMENKKVMSL